MKALICPLLGPAENLRVTEVEAPDGRRRRSFGRDRLCGAQLLRHADHRGQVSGKPKPPFSPGGESRPGGRAGTGSKGVSGRRPGDGRLRLWRGGGTDRDPANRLAQIPDGLALDKAAGLSVAYGTSLHALKQRAEMKPGETLLVLGASGGVGLAAVEIGKAMGARVIAGASSDEKLAFAKATARPRRSTPQARTCARASRRLRPTASTSFTIRSARADGNRAALARLEGEAPGDRLRVGRNSTPPAQHSPAQGLRYPRRLLGRIHFPRAGGAPTEPGPIDGLGQIGRLERPSPRQICARRLSARRSRRSRNARRSAKPCSRWALPRIRARCEKKPAAGFSRKSARTQRN